MAMRSRFTNQCIECEETIAVGDLLERCFHPSSRGMRWMHLECAALVMRRQDEQERSRLEWLHAARTRPGTLEFRLDRALAEARSMWPAATGLFSHVLERGIQAYTWAQIVMPRGGKVNSWAFKRRAPDLYERTNELLSEQAVDTFDGEHYTELVWWPEEVETEIFDGARLRAQWVWVRRS